MQLFKSAKTHQAKTPRSLTNSLTIRSPAMYRININKDDQLYKHRLINFIPFDKL